jgi:hypothetical protein
MGGRASAHTLLGHSPEALASTIASEYVHEGGTARHNPLPPSYNPHQHVLLRVPHHKICDTRQEGVAAPVRRPPLVSKRPTYVFF